MQHVWAGTGDRAEALTLPSHESEVISGVTWGTPDLVNTPAYWAVRCRWNDETIPDFVSKASSLMEDIGFCLLGGYGIKYEVNIAAFEWLKCHRVFDVSHELSERDIRELLLAPLEIDGRRVRYRFPNQRAKRINEMRCKLPAWTHSLNPLALRTKLMELSGIGPKTASWIVRNHLGSDDVAIIDIHVIRACQSMNVFPSNYTLPRDYEALEERFLAFAKAIDIRPSVLDAVIWTEVRGGLAS